MLLSRSLAKSLYSRKAHYLLSWKLNNMPRKDDLEHRAFNMILAKRNEGVLQCDLWRDLKANSREGSRISIRLEKRNLIRREKEFYEGRWTYRIFPKKHPVEMNLILDVPCVSCVEIPKCEPGNEVSPNFCVKLTQWLLSISKGRALDGELLF